MTLSEGTKLGPYEVMSPLGAGGMGEVYRARDTRLDREVAIKVLPDDMIRDKERILRFEREAKLLASLNHPNIAHVYGFEEAAISKFLVMEYVPGATLAHRLHCGALPVEESLELAKKIAEALEEAHSKGVIHRDLKPGNVMLGPDGAVKVLDFGLAKGLADHSSTAPRADSPTITADHTRPGVILGTAAYMSPEQARGKSLDKRTDIWSFGAILFECLSGTTPFGGENATDSLGAILHKEPDWALLPKQTPPSIHQLLRRCLSKDRSRRLHDIADARLEIESALSDPSPHRVDPFPVAPRRITAVFAFLAGAILVAVAVWVWQRSLPTSPPPIIRFALTDVGMPVDAFQGIALSPDGRQLVYRAIDTDGRERLRIRAFDSLDSKPLAGTELGWMPVFSPDGKEVAFYSTGFLKAVTLSSGVVRQIAQLNWGGYSGAVWMPDGSIIFAGSTSSFGRVDTAGKSVEPLDVKGLQAGEFVLSPSLLPGGNALLCGLSNGSRFDIAVYDLGEHTITRIAENGFTPVYTPTGHVIYQQGQDGPLMALAFDYRRRSTSGTPIPVVSDVATRVSYQVRLFTLSHHGTLAYIPKTSQLENGALSWVKRSGEEEQIFEVPRLIDTPRLSHNGRRIAFRAPAPDCHVWMHDLESGVTTRITREGDNHGIAWSQDDARIFFARLQVPEQWGVMATEINGTGAVEVLSPATIPRGFVSSVSPDGQWALTGGGLQGGSEDVFLVNLKDHDVRPLLNTRSIERAATFSIDGRYIAFVSEESGRGEVYVQSFPKADERHQVSTDGGYDPVWSPDGKELFFRAERKMMVAEVSSSPGFTAGRPHMLFETHNAWLGSSGLASYDVSADGQRFVMIRGRSSEGGAGIHVVLNWMDELKGMAPTEKSH